MRALRLFGKLDFFHFFKYCHCICTVARYSGDLTSNNNTEPYFASHKFFVIDVETSLPSDHIHLPVEIAIYAFSFKDGRHKTYHKLVDAGTMPS